jgi:type IV pilus assembly protein PilM
VVDIDAFAIQNAFETNYNPAPNATIALLNIGASIMNIVVTRGGMPLFTRDVSVGGNQFTDALQKDMNLSFEEAEQVKQGKSIEGVQSESVASLIQSVSEVLMLEIQKTFDFFRATTVGEQLQRIYVSGGCAKVEGFLDLLRAGSIAGRDVDPSRILPWKGIDLPIWMTSPSMAVAVGLALRSLTTR